MVRELLTNGLRIKYAYECMKLRTCAMPSTNGSPWTEIYWFFALTQRELDAPGVFSMHKVSLLASGSRKIN